MFKISYDNKITMVQGDTGVIRMRIHNYQLSLGDEVRFAIVNKANPSILLCQHSDKKIVLEKQVTVFEKDGGVRIVIYPYDTEHLQPGNYLYEIQVKTKDGRIDTVVPLASFTLMEGCIQGEFGQITPSEIELRFVRLENEIIPELETRITNVENEIDSVSSSLEQKVNYNDNNVNEIFIAPFFRYNGDSSVDLYTSNDGFNFTRVSNQPLYIGRDSCPYFYNGNFYMLLTHNVETPLYEFKIMKSKNLRDWETIKVNIGILTEQYNKCWAPEFFEDDNGKLYILFSLKVGNETINEVVYDDMRPYIVEVLDIENLIFGIPKKLDLDNINTIDPCIYKHNGTYYLYIKKEPSGKIQIWTSNNLIDWVKQVDAIPNLDFGMFEAMSIVKKDSTFIMYVDDCGYPNYSNGGNMQYCTSIDLINWSKPTKILTDNRTRHGSVYKITDRNAKIILNDFINTNLPMNVKSNNKNLSIRLKNNVNENGELWLDGKENINYYTLGNENITINKINNMNAQVFYITLETIRNQPSIVTFKNNDTLLTPDNKDLVISSVYGDNEVSIMFRKEGGRYRVVGVPNTFKETSNYIDLSTLAIDGVITELKINPNDFFHNSSATTITINNVSYAQEYYKNIPMKIYFCINHTSINSKIIIKSNGMIKTKGNIDFTIDGSNNGDEIYCFGRLHAPSTMPLRKIL